MKTLVFLVYLLFFSFSVFAQNSGFKVLLTEGTHTFGENQFITIGSEIPENQTIKFKGEYLAMMDSEGKTIELTEKGVYSMKDLKAKIKFQPNGLWRKCTEEKYFSLEKKPLRMKKTGSVHSSLNLVKVCMPTRITVYQNQLILNWFLREEKYTQKDIKSYQLYFIDFAEQIIATHETVKGEIVINLADSLFKEPSNTMLIYKVGAINQKGEKMEEIGQIDGFVCEKLEPDDYQTITKEISQLQNLDCPILSQLVLANYFEEKDLLIDAGLAYMKLFEMKNLALFHTLYQNFLYRNGLIKEAFFRE